LLDITGLTICAVIAGADTFTAIARFGRARRAWLEQNRAMQRVCEKLGFEIIYPKDQADEMVKAVLELE
jgi:hypothetical protein